MIEIKDLYAHYIRKPLPGDCGIVCETIDAAMAKLNRLLNDALSYFSYTLVAKGTATVSYNGTLITLQQHDLMITTPGARIVTVDVSDDYLAMCLMADEMTTYEMTDKRDAPVAIFPLLMIYSQNKLHLSKSEFDALNKWMMEITRYGVPENPLTKICLTSLYSLFLCEFINVENTRSIDDVEYGQPSKLFLDFLKLLPVHYIRHHDIGFYADSLCVTPIYLSRVVKLHSAQTVKEHIDRLLLSQATVMLKGSNKPIAIIAENLNFATPQSFCKFFVRKKGVSPRKYREIQNWHASI